MSERITLGELLSCNACGGLGTRGEVNGPCIACDGRGGASLTPADRLRLIAELAADLPGSGRTLKLWGTEAVEFVAALPRAKGRTSVYQYPDRFTAIDVATLEIDGLTIEAQARARPATVAEIAALRRDGRAPLPEDCVRSSSVPR